MSYQTNVIPILNELPSFFPSLKTWGEPRDRAATVRERKSSPLPHGRGSVSRMAYGVILFCIFISSYSFASSAWKALTPGIEYQDLQGGIITPWSHVYAFRIDLNYNSLALISAKQLGEKYAAADQFAKRSNALISSNAGFFDHNFNPLGLRISNYAVTNPLKRISWWGVFYIKNNKPYIASPKQFQMSNNIEFAIQSGPRLIVNGNIPSLKLGSADRSALGITRDGKVILLVTTNAAMSTKELANLMKSPPLSCKDAINLDGGSSSQIYAYIGSFLLNVHGYSKVSDAIIVQRKK